MMPTMGYNPMAPSGVMSAMNTPWTPPPPPKTPPVLEHDEERERMAMARQSMKGS